MSQSDIVLEALKRGPLTKLDAFRLGAGLSLNSRIADLRLQGWNIACAVETREGRKVWVYRLLGPVQRSLFEEARV
jgi:hypothetical protein